MIPAVAGVLARSNLIACAATAAARRTRLQQVGDTVRPHLQAACGALSPAAGSRRLPVSACRL